jgi:hypothetical protein
MTEYDKNEIAKLIGRPVRTIEYYSRIGLPDVEPPGRGRAQVYSGRNLVEFAMIEILSRRLARTLELVGAILKLIRTEVDDFFSSDEWGNSKELVFRELMTPASKKGEATEDDILFTIIYKGEDGSFPLDINAGFEDKTHLEDRITWLGAVKKEALELIKRN